MREHSLVFILLELLSFYLFLLVPVCLYFKDAAGELNLLFRRFCGGDCWDGRFQISLVGMALLFQAVLYLGNVLCHYIELVVIQYRYSFLWVHSCIVDGGECHLD